MPDSLDVPGAHLQLGRHHPPASRGIEAVPDHGPHLAQDNEQVQEHPEGRLMESFVVTLHGVRCCHRHDAFAEFCSVQ